MARAKKFRWGAISFGDPGGSSPAPRPVDHAQPADQQRPGHGQARLPPLIARGYTDAPEGTAVVAGDPAGGSVLVELRVKDGQKVKKGEIVAVLSNYAPAPT